MRKKSKYKPGKVIAGGHLPQPLKAKNKAVTKALIALTAIREGFYDREIGLKLVMFLTICRGAISNEDQYGLELLCRTFHALNTIIDRQKRTGKWGVTGDERKQLSEDVPLLVEVYEQLNRAEIESGHLNVKDRLRRTLHTIDKSPESGKIKA